MGILGVETFSAAPLCTHAWSLICMNS